MDEKGINVDLSGFSVLSTLNDLEGIYIRQKFLVIEALTGCQTPNVYNVFAGNEKGHQVGNKPIFQCREKSECLQRIFLLANCRAFEINVKQDDSHDQVVLKFDRDCRCTCLCFNRPHMDVKLISKSRQENIGRIVCPFYWCDKGVHVHGQGDELRYKIIAGCCQLGNWCFCSCQACQTIQFDVYDASHQKVGELWKRSAGCIKQCLDSTDNFEIQFPPNATGSDKALLMASAIFIDYMQNLFIIFFFFYKKGTLKSTKTNQKLIIINIEYHKTNDSETISSFSLSYKIISNNYIMNTPISLCNPNYFIKNSENILFSNYTKMIMTIKYEMNDPVNSQSDTLYKYTNRETYINAFRE